MAPQWQPAIFPTDPLVEAICARYETMLKFSQSSAQGRNTVRRLYKLRDAGLTPNQADRMAVSLGCHPVEIWPDWYEALSRSPGSGLNGKATA